MARGSIISILPLVLSACSSPDSLVASNSYAPEATVRQKPVSLRLLSVADKLEANEARPALELYSITVFPTGKVRETGERVTFLKSGGTNYNPKTFDRSHMIAPLNLNKFIRQVALVAPVTNARNGAPIGCSDFVSDDTADANIDFGSSEYKSPDFTLFSSCKSLSGLSARVALRTAIKLATMSDYRKTTLFGDYG